MPFATPDSYTADAKLAGLNTARNMHTRIDGLHVVSAAGSYIVRVGDRFVSMSPDGLLALVSPAAEMDPEWPGVIREGCRWNTFDRERAERVAHHVNTHLCSGAVVEECLDACDNAIALLDR